MANALAFTLPTITAAETARRRAGTAESQVAIAATSAPTPAPDGDTPYILTDQNDTVRAFIAYQGTVTSAALTLWVLQDGTWYRGATATLDPTGGDEMRDMPLLGRYTQFALQLSALAGGGTATVRVLGVW